MGVRYGYVPHGLRDDRILSTLRSFRSSGRDCPSHLLSRNVIEEHPKVNPICAYYAAVMMGTKRDQLHVSDTRNQLEEPDVQWYYGH